MKMKKSKIIVPALGLLLLSTAASVSGTVAWFSANNTVSVTGMTVKTIVSDNILISPTNTIADFDTKLIQNRTNAVLEPASTINGESFFYTTNATPSGDAKENVYVEYSEATAGKNTDAGKTAYDEDFNEAYGQTTVTVSGDAITSSNTRYAYIDYSFYLQATNVSGAAANLNMTKCNLVYNSDGAGTWTAITEKAWRVAMFASESAYTSGNATTTEVTDAACAVAANEKTILAPSGATYFESSKAISSTSALAAVVNLNQASTVASIANGATKYYKVVVRLWLEGEDNTCNNATFATLTNDYRLDLAFKFDTALTALQSNPSLNA